MKLTLQRIAKKDTYTIGRLYIDGVKFCDTIEDADRGLNQSMDLEKIKSLKKANVTAIPTGTYKVTMGIKSPKYSNYGKYPWARKYNGKLPRLLNVPGYDGVLIHVGNTAKDTSGCILVGENKVVGKVINSAKWFTKLMDEYLTKVNTFELEVK